MLTLTDRLSKADLAKMVPHDFTDDHSERRMHRRADMDHYSIAVSRWEGEGRPGKPFGQIVDLSAGGIRIRTRQKQLRNDSQIRVQLELPDYAGISPFILRNKDNVQPTRQWVGWMSISRIKPMHDGLAEVAGRLVGMDEMDRGMLSLYLSTQPMAA